MRCRLLNPLATERVPMKDEADLRLTPILSASQVTKRFGALVAVDHVDFQVVANEVVGILGSNGAGKTTFFNLLTGMFFADEGVIQFKCDDITRLAPTKRVGRGLIRSFQLTSTFDTLTVIDNLALAWFRAHRGIGLNRLLRTRMARLNTEPDVQEALEMFDLGGIRSRLVQNLSLGEKRRLEIAMSMLARPEVLLLDEPLAGLAESEIRGVLGVLRQQMGRLTIVMVEHKISHIEEFVQRVVVMHEGRVISSGTYAECMRQPEVRRSYWQIETPELEPIV